MRYYLYSKKDEGLFDKEQLRDLQIKGDDLVKAEDADSWVEAEKVEDLADLFLNQFDFDAEEQFSENYADSDSSSEETASATGSESGDEQEAMPVVVSNQSVQPNATPVTFKRRQLAVFATVLLALTLLATNPKKADHYAVVQQMVAGQIQARSGSGFFGESFMDMFFGGFGFFDGMAVNRILDDVECRNAFFFSYSKVIDEEDGSHWLTLGVLGHIITMNQDALDSHISNVLYGSRHKKQKQQKQQKPRKQQQTVPEGGQSL